MRMRAAVLHAPGQRLVIEEVELAPPGPGEVLVRIGAAGLCHTDLEVMTGQLAYPMPIVLGHEAAGTIMDVGPGGDPGRVGERVVLSWNPHCGGCRACGRGQPILCERYLALGPRAVPFRGETALRCEAGPAHTMFYMAAFAEYAVVTEGCAVTVPAAMPFAAACLLGCGVLTGVGAATRIASIGFGDTVLVIGCGAVGLSAVQGARLAGAGRVIAADLVAGKLEAARAVGATEVVDASREDLVGAVLALTGGVGADVVLESAGHRDGFRASAEACRAGGQVVWLGKVGVNEDVPFRWGSLMGEKRFTRSSYGGARVAEDFPALAAAYLDGRLDLDRMITRRIGLAEINEGFDDLRAGRAIRSVVVFP